MFFRSGNYVPGPAEYASQAAADTVCGGYPAVKPCRPEAVVSSPVVFTHGLFGNFCDFNRVIHNLIISIKLR